MSSKERGNDAFKAKQYAEAKEFYTAALREDPFSAVLWANRAAVHLALGCSQYAAADAIRAVNLDDTYAKAHFRLGRAFSDMGGYKQAVAYFEKCQCLEPTAAVEKQLQEAKHQLEQGPSELQQSRGMNGKYSSFYNPPATARPTFKSETLKEFNQFLGQVAVTSSVEVGKSSFRGGLGLRATRGCSGGGEVLLQEPASLVISCDFDRCVVCAQTLGSAAVACKDCGAEKYCKADCQAFAMQQYHRVQCGIVAKEIAVLRSRTCGLTQSDSAHIKHNSHVLATLRIAGMIKQSVFPEGVSALPQFKHLYSLTDDAETDILSQIAHPFKQRYAQWAMLQSALDLDGLGHVVFDFEFYDELWHTLTASMFYDQPSGACVWMQSGAFANHSCEPNAAVEFSGGQVTFRALKPIRAGEEVLISYVDPQKSRSERLQLLQNTYWFTCKCNRCQAPSRVQQEGSSDEPQPMEEDSDDWLHEAARMMGTLKLMVRDHPQGRLVLAVMHKYGWDGSAFHGVTSRAEFENDFRVAFEALGF